jgi:hypothetical protein
MTIKLETDDCGHPKTQFLQVCVLPCGALNSVLQTGLLSKLLRKTRQTGEQCKQAAEPAVPRGSERSLEGSLSSGDHPLLPGVPPPAACCSLLSGKNPCEAY